VTQKLSFEEGKPLKEISTFGIGGNARYFTSATSIEQMQEIIRYCHLEDLPYFILGKGSNSLFDDRGFDGLVILNKILFCQMEFPLVSVGAGYSFSLLGVQTARSGWSGLEFASGIPASVGGAIYMNAGANGGETADCLYEVSYVTDTGELEILSKDKLSFSYRHSCFQGKRGSIVAAKFMLTSSSAARQKQLGIVDYRMRTQPYGEMSAGCVFRNPLPHPAGALIEQAGLKGVSIGGAAVSTVHANFIVNKGGASAQDVLMLAEHVRKVVKEKRGVDLEMEIRTVPYDTRSS
jgi:UDP-N-acetylmuramate dehydrogenase